MVGSLDNGSLDYQYAVVLRILDMKGPMNSNVIWVRL